MPLYRVEYTNDSEEVVEAPDLKTLALFLLEKKVKRVWVECKDRLDALRR